jgi:membrane-associated phospholipid phosphatase
MSVATLEPAYGSKRLLRLHLILVLLAATYACLSLWLARRHSVVGTNDTFLELFIGFIVLIPQIIFLLLFCRLINLTYIERSTNRFEDLKREIVAMLSDRHRLFVGLATTLVMAVVVISFAQIKNLIPDLQPFVWDRFFVDLDRSLHFSRLPHEYLLPLFNWQYVISFFTGIYNVWLFMMYFVLVIACFMRPESALRMQFLIAFVLTWAIGGNLMAALFSSAGPVYLERLGLGTDYAVLMQALQAHAATGALTVIETQDLLWRWLTAEQPINAISAFPSMHVASSTLMALFAFRMSRWAGLAMSGFALGIMLGSVLLAWHYAVDGYVGALIAVICWQVSGWLVRWSRHEPGLAPSP